MKRIKVLLIDDELELISTLAERLEYRDIDADIALNGNEALEKFEQNQYDLLVIDLKMPGMSGPELINKVKEKDSEIPIFLMTGHGITLDGEEIPEGIVDYLPKTVKIDVLIQKIQEVLQTDE